MSKILLKPQSRAGQISPIVFLIFLGISGYLNAQTFAYVSNKQQIKQGEPTDPATPKARQLVQVFNELKSHYGVTFMYEDRVLVGKTIVGAIQYEAKIEKTLDVLLKPIGLKYKEVKTGTFVITDDQTKKSSKALFQEGVNLKSIDSKPLVESIGEANGSVSMVSSNGMSVITPADVPIRGKVTDINGVPLPGANITLKNSQKGTTTAADGSFSFDVPTQNAIIVVSYIGYEGMEVRIGNQTMFNIKLKIDDKSLNEVVVIGYGSRDKRDITGSVSSVKAEEISKSNYVAPEMAMQGRMTGVQVTQGSGEPNARPQVRIRGVGTFGNTEPLYVVDGVPINEYGNGVNDGVVGDIRGNVNILSMINPGDIESISVLKDAAASAVYGVRAAHGVILITTKKGQIGKPRVEFNAARGVQNIRKTYDMMNVQQNVGLIREAYANNIDEAKNLPVEFDPTNPKYLGNRPSVDWVTPALNKNAVVEDYSVRVSGGTEATKYYVSGGYSRTQSPMVQNQLERFSLAANIETRVSKYLSVGVNYRNSLTTALDNTQTDIGYLSGTTPWQPIYDPKGVNGFAPAYNVTFKANDKFVPTDLTSGSAFDLDKTEPLWGPETNANPYAWHTLRKTDYSIISNVGNGFVQIEPINGLKIKGTIGLNWFYNRRNSWEDFNSYLFS